MENKMMNILQNMGLAKIGPEITYSPYTKTRKSFCIHKQLYEFPKRNTIGFKNCAVYFLKRLQYNPERIMLTGGDKYSLEKTVAYLNIIIDSTKVNTEKETLFNQLYDDYFIYEDEHNYISGGINKITNLSEIIISKKEILGFNNLISDHLHFITKQLNDIYIDYDFNKIIFDKIKGKNILKCDLKLTFSKSIYIEKITEILDNQKQITDNLLNVMEFIFSNAKQNDYLLDKLKEICLQTDKTNLRWIRLLRKYHKPDIILYFGTGLFNKNNNLELNFSLYNKTGYE